MMTPYHDQTSRVADVLEKPGPPFQNWIAEVGARIAQLATTLAHLAELAVSKCPVCKDVDSVGWLRVGDHETCRQKEKIARRLEL